MKPTAVGNISVVCITYILYYRVLLLPIIIIVFFFIYYYYLIKPVRVRRMTKFYVEYLTYILMQDVYPSGLQ